MTPKYMNEFANELQFMVVRSLKRKGSAIKKGKFTISKHTEKYLTKKYKVSKQMQISSILAEMKLNQRIVKTISDPNECFVRNFKIRLGRHRQIKYYTPGGPTHFQTANSFIHWEFRRVIRMAEENNKLSVSNWNAIHEARFLKLSNNLKKLK